MPHKDRALTLLVAAALSVAGGCAGAQAAQRGRPTPPAVGETLRLEAPALDGASVRLAPGTGKVRVVDFWASWCEPCRHSLPDLDRIARDLGPQGVEVYGVALDDDRDEVSAFLRDVPVGFPVLWDRAGERSAAARLPVVRLPTTLIVDRLGVIRYVHEGWTERIGREQRAQVEALLRE